jgi:protoporphyrinogen oxidase
VPAGRGRNPEIELLAAVLIPRMQLPELPRDAPSSCAPKRLTMRRPTRVLRTDEQNAVQRNSRALVQFGDIHPAKLPSISRSKRAGPVYSAGVAADASRMEVCRKRWTLLSEITTGAGVCGSIEAR